MKENEASQRSVLKHPPAPHQMQATKIINPADRNQEIQQPQTNFNKTFRSQQLRYFWNGQFSWHKYIVEVFCIPRPLLWDKGCETSCRQVRRTAFVQELQSRLSGRILSLVLWILFWAMMNQVCRQTPKSWALCSRLSSENFVLLDGKLSMTRRKHEATRHIIHLHKQPDNAIGRAKHI